MSISKSKSKSKSKPPEKHYLTRRAVKLSNNLSEPTELSFEPTELLIEPTELSECIICYDNTKTKQLYKLQDAITLFNHFRTCKCICDIHSDCLQLWISKQFKCPVCRKPIMKTRMLAMGNIFENEGIAIIQRFKRTADFCKKLFTTFLMLIILWNFVVQVCVIIAMLKSFDLI